MQQIVDKQDIESFGLRMVRKLCLVGLERVFYRRENEERYYDSTIAPSNTPILPLEVERTAKSIGTYIA